MIEQTQQRTWQVLLIGGASGSGKTSVSYRLAHHFNIGITEADDIHLAILRMTTPEQQPLLHYWGTHPETRQWPPARIFEHMLKEFEHLSPAFETVIANHLESNVPLVLEGDYLLPALAAQASFNGIANAGRVRALYLHEEDEEQIVQNFLRREPEAGRQAVRARVSWLFSRWLREQALATGSIVLDARPWENSFQRILDRLAE